MPALVTPCPVAAVASEVIAVATALKIAASQTAQEGPQAAVAVLVDPTLAL